MSDSATEYDKLFIGGKWTKPSTSDVIEVRCPATGEYVGAAARTLGRLAAAHRDDELALYRVGGQTSGASSARLKATMLAHWAWLSMLLVGGAGAAGYWVRRHLHHCEDTPASRAQD